MLTLPCDRMEKSFLPHTAACVRGVFCNYCSKKQEKKKKEKRMNIFKVIDIPIDGRFCFVQLCF